LHRISCKLQAGLAAFWERFALDNESSAAGVPAVRSSELSPFWRELGYNVAQESFMSANAVVRARIDAHVKEEAAAIYAAAGLTLSDAFRMMLMRTVAERALPFEPLMPNAETVKAMKAARRGELVKVGSVDKLLADLHADD
jgi:DNA-damage-inducible protein J